MQKPPSNTELGLLSLRTAAIAVVCTLAFAWLLVQLSPILAPFIAAAILAYILNPLVIHVCKWHIKSLTMPRTLSSSLIMLTFVACAVGLTLVVLPVLKTEANLLQARLPALIEQVNTAWLPWFNQHLGTQIKIDAASVKNWLSSLSLDGDLGAHVLAAIKTGSSALLGFVGTAALSLVLAFYFLLDWPDLMSRFKALVPNRWRSVLGQLSADCDAVLGQYLRGQLSVMLALCVYYCVALWFAGFDVALPVGLLTGLLIIIPYLGFAFGLLLALAAAVLQFQGWNGVIWVAVIYGFGQILEGFFLTPRWVGASLGLHPAAVIFALLAFGQLLGFAGVLLALPMAAVVVVVGKYSLKQYRSSRWYLEH